MKSGPSDEGIEASFVSTITSSQLPDALSDVAEVSIDSFIQNPLLKEIPVVKTVAGLIQTGANIQDRLFLKKILTFLQGIDDIKASDRKRLINNIDQSQKYQVKVGEKLLYILDTCDDHTNAKNVSRLFAAFLKKKITYTQYVGAAQIMARISQQELDQFLEAYKYHWIDDKASDLAHTGLLYSETSEVEVEVDLRKISQDEWDDPEEHYEADTNTSGGEITLKPTPNGRIIFEVFGIGEKALEAQWKKEREISRDNLRKKNEAQK